MLKSGRFKLGIGRNLCFSVGIGCEHPFTTLATEKSISITFGCLTDTAWATPDPAFPTQPRLEASATEKTILLHFQLSSTLSKSNMVMEYPRFWYALPLYRNIFQMGIPHLTCLHHVVPSYNESAPCRSLLIPGTCQTIDDRSPIPIIPRSQGSSEGFGDILGIPLFSDKPN